MKLFFRASLLLSSAVAFSPLSSNIRLRTALNMADQDELKKQVGYKAVDDYVQSGMVVGLGTGSTAYYAVERVGEKLNSGELKDILAIPTGSNDFATGDRVADFVFSCTTNMRALTAVTWSGVYGEKVKVAGFLLGESHKDIVVNVRLMLLTVHRKVGCWSVIPVRPSMHSHFYRRHIVHGSFPAGQATFIRFTSNVSNEMNRRDGRAMGVMEDCYPQMLQSIFICDAPAWVQIPWQIVRPIMPKRVVEKLDFLSPVKKKKDLDKILRYIDVEKLPEHFGGNHKAWPADHPLPNIQY